MTTESSDEQQSKRQRRQRRPQLPLDWREEDILPVYMVLRIICDTLGEPTLIDKVMAPQSSTGIGPMDLMMMCCIKKNPAAWKKAIAESNKHQPAKQGAANRPAAGKR